MIDILPQTQLREHVVTLIDNTIAVAAVFRLVIFSQRAKAVLFNTGRLVSLESEIAKQFFAVVDHTVSISIEHQPCSSRRRTRPGQAIRRAIRIQIKADAIVDVRQIESARNIDQNRRATAPIAASAETKMGVVITIVHVALVDVGAAASASRSTEKTQATIATG